MNIHSIRLKNIKSYGEGLDGNGVVVSFESGVNRIAGKNGHGKTTLIESLGYALFLTQPQHEENFRLDKYFLRNGCKAGEIDVTFGDHGETYRIERGLGSQNKRRSKVIDASDGSTCAEGDVEVSQFLCKLFGFPSEDRFSELFSKLIGVRQGWLTRPFDSKPGASKRFFEPLLEVEIFRRCFDELKPAIDQIALLKQEQDVKLAGIEAKVQDRADSPETLKQSREKKARLGDLLKKAEKEQTESRKKKETLEQKEKAVQQAEKNHVLAKNAAEKAADQRKTAEERVGESKKAMEKVRVSTTGHTAFVTAESALKQLRERERARTTLEKQKTEADKRRIDLDGKVKAAKEQADTFAKQLKKKDEELAGVRKKLTPLEDELKETVKAYEDSQAAVKQLDSDRDELRGFVRRLPEFCADREEELKKVKKLAAELAAWDAKKLTDAKSREDTAEKALQGLRDQFTQARERKEALAKQLEEIGGGMCPFLKEQCRQFDPAKVQGDVQAIEKQIKELESKDGPARKAHEDAKKEREFLSAQENQLTPKRNQLGDEIASYLRALRTLVSELVAAAAARAPKHLEGDQESFPTAPHVPGKIEDAEGLKTLHEKLVRFCEDGASWWNTLDPRIDTKLEELEKAKIQRQKDEHSLEGFKVKLVDLQKEIKGLADDEKAKRDESTGTAAEVKKAADEVSELGEQLKQYADVAEAITKQEGLLDEHRDAYKVYLTHKPIANQLKDRETELSGKKKDERKRADELKEEEQALSEAKKGFDPLQLKAARTDHEEKSKAATSCQTDLKYADQALQQEEKRFEEWKDSIKSKEAVDDELHKLAAAAELGQLARSVLQKSAPAVARHLCNRIAGRAQRIFNQINQDPIELNWEAHSYSLRIAPGDRRFAMLSGGEQTKLALSMTLAMAQEFSDLRFCIFDEPTYGVDADSRPLLADAILEAQEAAGLEQLLLVSHDDAFEGKIEHAVLLGKSAQSGSEVISLG